MDEFDNLSPDEMLQLATGGQGQQRQDESLDTLTPDEMLQTALSGSLPKQRTTRLDEARQRQQGQGEGGLERVLRRAVPFVSTVARGVEGIRAQQAQQRIAANKAYDEDYDTVARYERLQQVASERGVGGKVIDAAIGLPAIVGEGAVGSMAAGPIRAVQAGGVLPTLARGGAQLTVQTAAMPSMYLDDAQRRAAESGSTWSDPENLAPAFANGMLQTAILGRLGKPVGDLPTKGLRWGVRTAAGLAESEAASAVAKWGGLETKYGTITELVKGKGNWGDAVAHAFTFAAFAAMHSPGDGAQRQRVKDAAVEDFLIQAARLKAQGYSAKEAGKRLASDFGKLAEMAQEPVKSLQTSSEASSAKTPSEQSIAQPSTPQEAAAVPEAKATPEIPPTGRIKPESAFSEAFPGARPVEREGKPVEGQYRASVGESEVYLRPGVGEGTVEVDFTQPGAVAGSGRDLVKIARGLKPFLEKMKDSGVDIEYTATDTSRKAGARTSRGEIYAEGLAKAGYELVSVDKEGLAPRYRWRYAGKEAEYQKLHRSVQPVQTPPPNPQKPGSVDVLAELGAKYGILKPEPAAAPQQTQPPQRGIVPMEPPPRPPVPPGTPAPVRPAQPPQRGIRPMEPPPRPPVPPGTQPPKPPTQPPAKPSLRERLAAAKKEATAPKPPEVPKLDRFQLAEKKAAEERAAQDVTFAKMAEVLAGSAEPPMPEAEKPRTRAETAIDEAFTAAAKTLSDDAPKAAIEALAKGGLEKADVRKAKQAITNYMRKLNSFAGGEQEVNSDLVDQISKSSLSFEQQASLTMLLKGFSVREAELMVKGMPGFKGGKSYESIRKRATEAVDALRQSHEETWGEFTTVSEFLKMDSEAKAAELARLTTRSNEQPDRADPTAESEFEKTIERMDAELQAGPDRGRPTLKRGRDRFEDIPEPPSSIGGKTLEIDGVLYAPSSPSPTPSGTGTGKVSPFDIIATNEAILGGKTYVLRGSPGDAAYDAFARAVVKSKMGAGDVQKDVHERGHDLAVRNGFESDPTKLPADVADGFRQFDYMPNRPNGKTAMLEGFAEFFRYRSIDQLKNLTPEQKAAAEYGEKFLADKGFTAAADRIKEMFADYLGQSPEEQASRLASATGRPADPNLTLGEQAARVGRSAINSFVDNVENNLAPLLRAEATLSKNLGRPLKPEEKASLVYSRLMFGEKHLAGEFEREGVHTIQDGKKTVIGLPMEKITEGAKPEWLAGKDDKASRAGSYALARHIDGEWSRGREVVPEEQYRQFKALLDAERADPEFGPWAEQFSQRLTDAFAATRLALESADVHLLPKGTTAELMKERPDYVPTERVIMDAGWQTRTGIKGEQMPSVLKKRSGSAEQIVDPIISYKKRLAVTAWLLSEQLRRNAEARLYLQDGMGEYAKAGGATWTEEGAAAAQTKAMSQILQDLGLTDVSQILSEIGAGQAMAYFTTQPWPQDGSKPMRWWIGPDGKATNFIIGDRSLYDLVTGFQTDANQTARLFRGIGHFGVDVPGVGRLEPIRQTTKLVKAGATAASLGFQVRNVPRDVVTFWKNTIDRASMADLPVAYRDAYRFAWDELKSRFTGRRSSDRLFREFYDARGDQLRELAFDRSNPASAYGDANKSTPVKVLNGVSGFMKDVFGVLGAGELAPRYQEWKNRLKQTTGMTPEQLRAAFAKADADAAAGKPWQSPIDFTLMNDAMEAAAEVTVNFGRQGTITREINKITPFFGPAIAGMSKSIRNWKTNPKGAAFALSAYLALRALHWAMFNDEDWYKELQTEDRLNGFVVPTPVGLRRFPGPRDVDSTAGGFLLSVLDAAKGRNPRLGEAVRNSLSQSAPPAPVPPVAKVAWELQGNEGWTGRPIVPRRDQEAPPEVKAKYQVPYAADQLTGGRLSARQLPEKPSDLIPFGEVRNATRSIDRYYEKLAELKGERQQATRSGKRYEKEQQYARLHAVEEQMKKLNTAYRTASKEKQKEIRALQLSIAQKAIKAIGAAD